MAEITQFKGYDSPTPTIPRPDHPVEPAIAQEHFPHGEQGPLLPHDLQCAGHGTGPRLGGYCRHALTVP